MGQIEKISNNLKEKKLKKEKKIFVAFKNPINKFDIERIKEASNNLQEIRNQKKNIIFKKQKSTADYELYITAYEKFYPDLMSEKNKI